MMLAALSGVPYEVEEAAEIDGCNWLQKLFKVTLPIIRPTAQVVIIVLTISFFNIITIVLELTGGGPEYATEILSIRLYKEGFLFFNISTASTLTTIMLVVNLALAWVYRRLIRAEGSF
jgi:ABC-type sugar transport system permease subunit